MLKSYAVIGAGYGDEGKGALTDYFAHRLTAEGKAPFVVRCNGGAQAGHTVVTPDGNRHVFHHHGSGTFVGAPTYLSADFIVNPIVFEDEHRHLESFHPYIAVSPEATVTLPIDMITNQALEESRSKTGDRHGSCGMGINETVVRSQIPAFSIKVKNLSFLTLKLLKMIRENYGYKRLEELNITKPSHYDSESIDSKFLDSIEYFRTHTLFLTSQQLDILGDSVIFEGAQGLGLDEHYGHFPHVTRSRTGLTNILKLTRDLKIPDLETVYVTRCYATRHGAGPLEWEGEDHLATIEDPTNIHNDWQHSLRSAPLDIGLLIKRITRDRSGEISIAVTCLDQAKDKIRAVFNGSGITETSTLGLIDYLQKSLGAKYCYGGIGPTRENYFRRQIFS